MSEESRKNGADYGRFRAVDTIGTALGMYGFTFETEKIPRGVIIDMAGYVRALMSSAGTESSALYRYLVRTQSKIATRAIASPDKATSDEMIALAVARVDELTAYREQLQELMIPLIDKHIRTIKPSVLLGV